jgi:hypothetical protein
VNLAKNQQLIGGHTTSLASLARSGEAGFLSQV